MAEEQKRQPLGNNEESINESFRDKTLIQNLGTGVEKSINKANNLPTLIPNRPTVEQDLRQAELGSWRDSR